MIRLSTTYNEKWYIKGAERYTVTECGKVINTRTRRIVKRVVKGYSIGYCINGNFVNLNAMITTELTIELQREILDKMFGFTLVDESDGGEQHYVVYDEDGNEFYGSNENCKYDLSTFGGIIRYAEDRGYKMGYLSCQMDMRKVLGVS